MKGETTRRQLLKERDGISGHLFTSAAARLLAEQYWRGVRMNRCREIAYIALMNCLRAVLPSMHFAHLSCLQSPKKLGFDIPMLCRV